MPDRDLEILTTLLKKENEFEEEVCKMCRLSESKELSDNLADYFNGLNDLKNDFLFPAKQNLSKNESSPSLLFSDKYWYFQRAQAE